MANQRKKNTYTNPSDKIAAVKQVMNNTKTTQQVAEEMNVSLTSVQQWVKQYRDFGEEYFQKKPKKKGPEVTVQKSELDHLKAIEKKYKNQLIQVEILKKFQSFLKEN